jgi:hypothetical protein
MLLKTKKGGNLGIGAKHPAPYIRLEVDNQKGSATRINYGRISV